ncbi:MAG: hypothetical protein PF444_09205 [Bacteroidales bacterium]|nr:hypothetical protein [Bacteroidales bacterium]
MMKKHNRFLYFLFILSLSVSAVAKLPTSQWQTHMSYTEGQRLAVSDNKVYVVASGSLFSYGLNDNSLETYTKIEGLSDVYINDIAFCTTTETLVICYDNGNIDLMDKEGIINIPDLYLKVIYGDKTINKVDIFEGTAYISTAFGILKLNIAKAEITETYKLSDNDANGSNGVAILDNEIYAATDNGLYKADLNHYNLQDFSAWRKVSITGGYNSAILDIIAFSEQLVVVQNNTNQYYFSRLENKTSWKLFARTSSFVSLSSNSDELSLSCSFSIVRFNSEFSQQSSIDSYHFSNLEYNSQNQLSANYTIPMGNDTYFVADGYQGLIKHTLTGSSDVYHPQGPATNMIWDIDITESVVRTVHGATSPDYNNTWTSGAFSSYISDEWTNYTKENASITQQDLVGIITDPLDVNHFFISSFGYGVLEYQDNELVQQYDENNSTLENAIPGSTRYTRTIGMAFDSKNNLWVNNSSAQKQLHVKTTDDEWFAFKSDLTKEFIRYSKIVILDDDTKWMVAPYFGNGILAYDDKGTYDDTSDDDDKYFSIYSNSSGSSELVSDKVFDLTIDNDGVIWVGSDNGVALYYSPDNIFDTNTIPNASRINIPRNDGTGLGDYLLDGSSVNSIAVDGGNRKWLATQSTGVLLVSSDGQDVLHHFTKENSPLLDNNVRQVEINQETGEVFFATEAGLISFQADATTGEEDFSNLKVYPNPVREDFFGDITITGLVDETTVKITDVSGNLVKETSSNGGTAVWDGKNFYGERVGTGVYLIFCSDKEGERSGMTKVLVIN